MRVVVTGATGNVGTGVLTALSADDRVEEIVGLARREPAWTPPRTRWAQADVAEDDLLPLFAGADVVIHLAWLIQPSRDATTLERVNVGGSRRLFEAAAEAGVSRLVHASSVGVYSPGPKDRLVDELERAAHEQRPVPVRRDDRGVHLGLVGGRLAALAAGGLLLLARAVLLAAALLPPPEPDFFPPRLDEPSEFAIAAARLLLMPFLRRPSYCLSFLMLEP